MNQFQQSGLAGTITTYKAYPFPLFDSQINRVEQYGTAEADAYIF
jgi:hypothetical protein